MFIVFSDARGSSSCVRGWARIRVDPLRTFIIITSFLVRIFVGVLLMFFCCCCCWIFTSKRSRLSFVVNWKDDSIGRRYYFVGDFKLGVSNAKPFAGHFFPLFTTLRAWLSAITLLKLAICTCT